MVKPSNTFVEDRFIVVYGFPSNVHTFQVMEQGIGYQTTKHAGGVIGVGIGSLSDWEIAGLHSAESPLTEEIVHGFWPTYYSDSFQCHMHESFDDGCAHFFTGQQALSAYLKAKGLFLANPHGAKRPVVNDGPDSRSQYYGTGTDLHSVWDAAEANTGPFLFLKRKS